MINIKCYRSPAVFAVLALTGCFGVTEDASEVTQTSAILHASTTCASDDCDVYFEYWPADSSAAWGLATTIEEARDIPPLPPGLDAWPYNKQVNNLQPDTEYDFRVCGKELSEPAYKCASSKTFRTLPPAEIASFVAELSETNIVTLRWETEGGSTGEPIHIYGAYTDPVTGVAHRNVGFRNEHDNLEGLSFRVGPGTHRYVLELPTPTGKVHRSIELSVAQPSPPVVTSAAMYLYPSQLSDTTVAWQSLPEGQHIRIGVDDFPSIKLPAGQNSHVFTEHYLGEVLGLGKHKVRISACIDMTNLLPKMNANFCGQGTRADISIRGAQFLGPTRHFASTGSAVTISWKETSELTVLFAPEALGGTQLVEGTSHTFYDLEPGIHDISIDSCLSEPEECASIGVVTAPADGTLEYEVEVADEPAYFFGLFLNGAAKDQEIAQIRLANGDLEPVLTPRAGRIINSYFTRNDSVSAGDILFMQQSETLSKTQIVVSEDPFVQVSWTEDFGVFTRARHDLPRFSHVSLGQTLPVMIAADDDSVWAAGEFAEGSITHITGSLGDYRIFPLAVPLHNSLDVAGNRLVPVRPFQQASLGNSSLTKQEKVIEAGQYVWFINGGSSEGKDGEHNNWNRIVRFDRAGTDLNSTVYDDRFCVYHIPKNNAGVMGLDWDEENGLLWYVESRSSGESGNGILGWFDPAQLSCENFLDYQNPDAIAQASTKYCGEESSATDCIHEIQLIDWEDSERTISHLTGFVKVESDAVWVAGYYGGSNIARYDRNHDRVDIINTNPARPSSGFYESHIFLGSGPWQFLSTENALYFSEYIDGDVVRLDKQALAADTTGACKNPGPGVNNPCLSEIHATAGIKEIALHGNRLYFGGDKDIGYINFDTWTPGKVYTGLDQLRNAEAARTGDFTTGDMAVSATGMVVINDYSGRAVHRFYPLPPSQ